MITIKNIFTKLMLVAVSILMAGVSANAQDKISPKLRLSYFKYMNGTCEVKAKAYAKKDGETQACMGAIIGFYKDADEEQLFKKIKTDCMGMAVLSLNEQDATAFKDSTGQYHFYAKLEKDNKYKSQEADITAFDAVINAEFKQENDSTRILRASIMCFDAATKKMIPGAKVALKCGVKRALCLLPVGKDLNYTDDQGNVEISFPNDIPGDKDGNLTVIVKLDDDDSYGTVQYERAVKWGVPLLHSENPLTERSIIGNANNAPWFIVISISAILISIWGYLCYIVYGLFRISKLGK